MCENDDEPIHLREDEHFHSGPAQPRKFTIIVNGQKKSGHDQER